MKWYREQKSASRSLPSINFSRKRKECGRGAQKFTTEIAAKLIEINNAKWGKLSFKRLAGKLHDEGIQVSHVAVGTWCKELMMQRRRRYIKPKLTLGHRINRLTFALDQVNQQAGRFSDLKNTVHSDEKWFYLMSDGQVCRVFPNNRGEYRLPAPPHVYHKSRRPKVMVLAVCARPRPEYGFDGKVGLWSFTLERPAKRSNVRTGTVVGETMILEDVCVDAAVYRQKLIGKDGVFSSCVRKCGGSTRPHGTLPYGAGVYLAELSRVTSGHSMPNKAASVRRQDSRYFFSTMEHGRTLRSSTDVYSRSTEKVQLCHRRSGLSLRRART